MRKMDSYREKVFPADTLTHPRLYIPDHKHSGAEPARTMSDDSDDLHRDSPRLQTILDSSCSTCDISGARSKYRPHPQACRSLKPNFNNMSFSEKHSKKSRAYAEQYWACAIPDSVPPRPDRTSPHWDPNKEYQDLLDYTYPLNPQCFTDKDEEDDGADAFLHDSGVDLDSYNASCDSKIDSFTSMYREDHKAKTSSYLHANQNLPFAFSTPLLTGYHSSLNRPGSSNVTLCGDFLPYASKSDLARVCSSSLSPNKYDALDKLFSKYGSSGGCSHGSAQYLPTTTVLPLHKDLDTDEEYLSLPPTLKELETLATHLKDLSLIVADKDQGSGAKTKSRVSNDDLEGRRYIDDVFNHDVSKMDSFSSLRDMLVGRGSSEVLDVSGCASVKGNNSLIQRIQEFCQHLDKLIQWLYSVAEVTGKWTAPKPDIESIQLALNLYLKLKKDVAEQQVLTNSVMKDGESLVRCLILNSSVLKDALSLMSKQSGELERHTERLYASILGAMDTITEQSWARNGSRKQHVSLEMESR